MPALADRRQRPPPTPAPAPAEGHRVPRRHGRARPFRQTVSRLRLAGAADHLRRERDELLPALPDRRQGPRRSLALAPAERRLATLDRGAGDESEGRARLTAA